MPNVFVEVAIDPIGTASTSESDFIASAERVLMHAVSQGVDVNFKIGPMSTTLEGEFYQMLSLIAQMHEASFEEGAKRVISTIRIDDRRDKQTDLQHQVDVVEQKLAATKADMC